MRPMSTPPPEEPLGVLTMIRDIALWYGGAERLAVELMRRIDKTRFRPWLCVTRAPSDDRRRATDVAVAALEEAGVGVMELGRGSSADFLAWRRVLALLRRERIDILHTHMFRSNVPGAVLSTLARTPVFVAHEHTWSFEGRPLRVFLDRELVGRAADAYLAVSREDARRISEVEGIPARKVHMLPNGIPPFPTPSGHDVRAQLGIARDAPLVGSVGVLRQQKGFEVLVRAATAVRREVPGVKIAIAGAGDDPVREELERLIADRGLEDTVLLVGLRDDIPDFLEALDVAASPSHFEGSPLAVMEYMAAGRPTVATRVGGVPDLIEDGVHGLLVPPDDAPALAAGLVRLLKDRDLAGRLGAAARRREEAEFGIDAMVRRLERLYLDLNAAARAR